MRNGVSENELIDHAKATDNERVTLADIEAAIVYENFFTAADGVEGSELERRLTEARGTISVNPTWRHRVPQSEPLSLLTFCVLVLWNGYTVVGKSACADPKNFDAELGRRLARTDAVNQIWPLMGFELKCRLHREQQLISGKAFWDSPDMTTYIGTKVIHAKPMTRLEYSQLRGWQLPADENGFDEGYLVEYTDRIEEPQHVEGYFGYISWSPKEVFERAYRPVRQAERSEAATA